MVLGWSDIIWVPIINKCVCFRKKIIKFNQQTRIIFIHPLMHVRNFLYNLERKIIFTSDWFLIGSILKQVIVWKYNKNSFPFTGWSCVWSIIYFTINPSMKISSPSKYYNIISITNIILAVTFPISPRDIISKTRRTFYISDFWGSFVIAISSMQCGVRLFLLGVKIWDVYVYLLRRLVYLPSLTMLCWIVLEKLYTPNTIPWYMIYHI